jgi:gluconate 2-dehydrogenase alpha chain
MSVMPDITKPRKDAVLVGFGWTGAIMGMELTEAGLDVVALERGENRDTYPDFAYPRIADELTYGIRGKLFQNLSRETLTIRHSPRDRALPYRQLGSFLPGDGVGGGGVHWNGQHWRVLPEELRLKSHITERYGKDFIPEGLTIQDFGVSYEELEPFFDRFERVCGTSGKAGNLGGATLSGGNPFEGKRSREYPLPPLADVYGASLFAKAASDLGYHPFSEPASNASGPYTNPYGAQLGPCNFCGYCERFGCYKYAKASPQTTILPALLKRPNFELRTHSHVLRVNLDPAGQRAVGVTYVDGKGRTVYQPADLVVLCAFQLNNTKLLLQSRIGKPYNPSTGLGVVGRNYTYQMMGGVVVFFDKDKPMNPFIGSGAGGQVIDDFNGDHFDHGPPGFVGGGYIGVIQTGGRPIQQMLLPKDAPKWGSKWKQAAKDHYLYSVNVMTHGTVMSHRDNYLDLDPTYCDAFGQPLLRMTFDWKENDIKMTHYITGNAKEIADAMGGKSTEVTMKQFGDHYDTRVYQTTHNVGGAIMGEDPKTSVVNRYLQTWDVHNVFVMGSSVFPQNIGYNPLGLAGALTYWSAGAIRANYLKAPGPLVQS